MEKATMFLPTMNLRLEALEEELGLPVQKRSGSISIATFRMTAVEAAIRLKLDGTAPVSVESPFGLKMREVRRGRLQERIEQAMQRVARARVSAATEDAHDKGGADEDGTDDVR